MVATLMEAVPRTSQTLGYQLLAHAFVEAYAQSMFETPPLNAPVWIADHCSRHSARAGAVPDLARAAGVLETRLTHLGFPEECMTPLRALRTSNGSPIRVRKASPLLLDEHDADIAEFWAVHGPAERSAADHAKAVGEWSARLARRLALSRRDEAFVRRCGVLHDIGGPPHENLSSAEHALASERVLSCDSNFAEYAAVARSHHERLDGAGGPDGLRGAAIALPVRIVAVADRFHELIATPVAAPALQPDRALEQRAREAGAAYDVRVVAALHDLHDSRHR